MGVGAVTPADVKRARTSRGWTQEQLADRLGVSIHTVQSWEQGRRPVPAMAERLMRRLRLRWEQNDVG